MKKCRTIIIILMTITVMLSFLGCETEEKEQITQNNQDEKTDEINEQYQVAIDLFANGNFSEAQEVFDSLSIEYEDVNKYMLALNFVPKYVGTYKAYGTPNGFGGSSLSRSIFLLDASLEITGPYKLTYSTKYRDVEWAITCTINIHSSSVHNGEMTDYSQTFNEGFYYTDGKLTTPPVIKDTSGVTLLGNSHTMNKMIDLCFEDDTTIKVIEVPCDYTWATQYTRDMASIRFSKVK